METLWFCLVAFTLTVYVILDGYDLGTGILHLVVARTPAERSMLIRTIAPVWDGNEVWLLVAGGTIFAVFPVLLATAFSGFYLPLMMVLWLIAGRALGIELRRQIDSPLWTPAWDAVFSLSSGLLALFFGVALANVARGVPMQPDGTFFAPLWTDFSPGRASGILDPYTILAGLTAVAALAQHGGLWIAMRTSDAVQARARRSSAVAGWAAVGLTVLVTLWSRGLQPNLAARFSTQPWGFLFPAIAAAGLAAAQVFRKKGRDGAAFAGSAAYLAGMLASVAFSVFPYVLPSSTDPARGLTVHAAATDSHGMSVALGWWLPGVAVATGYFLWIHRKFSGKVDPSGDDHY